MATDMRDGSHDIVCFFPALAARIVDAVFMRDDDNADLVRRRVERLELENPYSAGNEPWLPETIWSVFRRYEQKDREDAEAARRKAGETLFRVEPDGKALLIDEHPFSQAPRTAESLAKAEDRLAGFGFEKARDGQVVSFRRDYPPFVLLADPRQEGKIEVEAYQLEPPEAQRGKPQWRRVGSTMSIPDFWWRCDPAKKFAAYLSKHIPAAKLTD
jgi:hypothetical protein